MNDIPLAPPGDGELHDVADSPEGEAGEEGQAQAQQRLI